MSIKQHTDNPWFTFIGICLVSFLGCLDFTIVDTALPSIQANLTATLTQLQWVINSFLLALAGLMVVLGKMADIYGKRKVLYCGMVGFAVFSLGAGLSNNIHWLICFRFLQGITVAITYTVPVALIPNLFPHNKVSKASSILVGVNGFGLALGWDWLSSGLDCDPKHNF